MRRAIGELVDFDRLNSGAMRLTALAVDVETGREAAFDTARGRVELDHLMASAALLPDYPAVEVDGRAYVDGGMAANVPVDLVLGEPPSEALSCFVADLFTASAPRPRRLGEANERQSDLIFAKQTDRTLRAMQQVWSLRQDMAPGAVYRLEYEYQQSEAALKSFDFSQSSLDRRWQRGEADMRVALALWRASPPAGTGLTIHPPVRRKAR
jgi:NTE family protein